MSKFIKLVQSIQPNVSEVSVQQAKEALDNNDQAVALDLREPDERSTGYIPGSQFAPRGIAEHYVETMIPDVSTPIYLYCSGGFRSILAADSLTKMGYTNVHSIEGGFAQWQTNYPSDNS